LVIRSVADRRRLDRRVVAGEAALAAGVRQGCGGEVLGLRAQCVSMASAGLRRNPEIHHKIQIFINNKNLSCKIDKYD
jgi:hypothetical protein